MTWTLLRNGFACEKEEFVLKVLWISETMVRREKFPAVKMDASAFALFFAMGDDPVFCADCVCDDSVRKIVQNSIADFNFAIEKLPFCGAALS